MAKPRYESCQKCGHNDVFGLEKCPRCGHRLSEDPAKEASSRTKIFRLLLFAAVLIIAIYPYLKKKFPQLEEFFEPGTHYERQGNEAYKQKKFRRALRFYRKAIKRSKGRGSRSRWSRGRLHYKMGLIHLYLKKNKKAIHHLQQANKERPRWFLPYYLLHQIYLQTRQTKKAKALLVEVQRRFPKKVMTWVLAGNTHFALKEYKKAKEAYEKALKIKPNHSRALNNLAWMLATAKDDKVRDLPRAVKLARRAVRVSKKQGYGPLDTLAEALFRQGKIKEAIATEKRALAQARTPENRRHARKQLQRFQKALLAGKKPASRRVVGGLSTTRRASAGHPISRGRPPLVPPGRQGRALPLPASPPATSRPTARPSRREPPQRRRAPAARKRSTSRPAPPSLPRQDPHPPSRQPILPHPY